MSGVNKVILVGNLGKDPDIRLNQGGEKIASLSVATGESWRDKTTGERKERTEWHRVVIFNEALAKVAEQYLKKGSKVYIEGSLRTRKYTDKSGVEKYTTEIVLSGFHSQLTMLDKREGVPAANSESDYGTTRSAERSPASSGAPDSFGANAAGGKRAGDDMDDEIPF